MKLFVNKLQEIESENNELNIQIKEITKKYQ